MTAPEGFTYIADFLTPEEQAALLRQVRALEFVHDRFRGVRLKRGYAQFGWAYVSNGRILKPAPPLPEYLIALADKARRHLPDGSDPFDQCIVTEYPEGAGIGWHTDAPRFGDCIIAVSLAAQAILQFRRNGTEPVGCEVVAAPGSLYVMCGPARWDWQHQVAPVASVRYSLTFRHVGQPARR